MKITIKENKVMYRFGDLKVGAVFRYDDRANESEEQQIYIKTNTAEKEEIRIGATNLSTGRFSYFGSGTLVELVDAELIVKR